MTKEMFTLKQVKLAAMFWYGKTDIGSLCLAENRLNRGEKFEDAE